MDVIGVCGTPVYMAPEVLRRQPYDGKADVFSLGICMLEMLLGRYPFQSEPESTGDFQEAIISGLRPEIPASCPLQLRELISACWRECPADRPSVDSIVDALQVIEQRLALKNEVASRIDDLPEEIIKLFDEQRSEIAFLKRSLDLTDSKYREEKLKAESLQIELDEANKRLAFLELQCQFTIDRHHSNHIHHDPPTDNDSISLPHSHSHPFPLRDSITNPIRSSDDADAMNSPSMMNGEMESISASPSPEFDPLLSSSDRAALSSSAPPRNHSDDADINLPLSTASSIPADSASLSSSSIILSPGESCPPLAMPSAIRPSSSSDSVQFESFIPSSSASISPPPSRNAVNGDGDVIADVDGDHLIEEIGSPSSSSLSSALHSSPSPSLSSSSSSSSPSSSPLSCSPSSFGDLPSPTIVGSPWFGSNNHDYSIPPQSPPNSWRITSQSQSHSALSSSQSELQLQLQSASIAIANS